MYPDALAFASAIADDDRMKLGWYLAPILAMTSVMAASAPPAGHYRLVGQQDVASELVLGSDGRFEYGLSAGALDEHAEGRWTSDGTTILLTTEPKPKPASFGLARSEHTTESPLHLGVTWPDGRGIPGVDFIITFDTGEPVTGYTQEYGWDLSPDEKRKPRSVEFAIPMYELKSQRFAIDSGDSNSLTFALTPNDLGVTDFEALPLTIGKDQLLMHRYGETLIYILQGK